MTSIHIPDKLKNDGGIISDSEIEDGKWMKPRMNKFMINKSKYTAQSHVDKGVNSVHHRLWKDKLVKT